SGDQGEVIYEGVQLTKDKRLHRRVSENAPDSKADCGPFKSDFTKRIDNTVKYMDERFQSFSQRPLFDTSLLPHDREKLATYSYDKIAELVKHFEKVLTKEEFDLIPQEWTDLKIWLAAHSGQKLHHLYTDLLQDNPSHLSHILVLLNLLLTPSPSTSICERIFLHEQSENMLSYISESQDL
ncbi:zinc finger protein 862-like, partial [Huso huso]